jgi:hypothetical protein
MAKKLDYRWHLRDLMALRGMYSTTDLRPKLAARGIDLSASQVYRLVAEKPERLNLKVLMALVDILGCRLDELIEAVAAAPETAPQKVASAGPNRTSTEAPLGDLRPRRARVKRNK